MLQAASGSTLHIRQIEMEDALMDPSANYNSTLTVLRSADGLRYLGEQEIEVLAAIGTLISADPAHILLPEGQAGMEFYLICSGTAEYNTHNAALAPVHFKPGEAGEFFGEVAALTGEVRTASVRAGGTEVLVVLKLNGADLPTLAEKCPKATTRMIEGLAYRLKRNAEQLRAYVPTAASEELEARKKLLLTPADNLLEKLAAIIANPMFLFAVVGGYVTWSALVWKSSHATWLSGLGAVMAVLGFSISTLLLYQQRRTGTVKATLDSVEYLANINSAAKVQELSTAMTHAAGVGARLDTVELRLERILGLLEDKVQPQGPAVISKD